MCNIYIKLYGYYVHMLTLGVDLAIEVADAMAKLSSHPDLISSTESLHTGKNVRKIMSKSTMCMFILLLSSKLVLKYVVR